MTKTNQLKRLLLLLSAIMNWTSDNAGVNISAIGLDQLTVSRFDCFCLRPLRKATLLWQFGVTEHWSLLGTVSTWSPAGGVGGRTSPPTSPPRWGWRWSVTAGGSPRPPTGEIMSSRRRWTQPQVGNDQQTLISSFCGETQWGFVKERHLTSPLHQ